MSMKHICDASSVSNLTNVQPQDLQPNAVDLRLGKVFKIGDQLFSINEREKKHRNNQLVEPTDGVYMLEPGHYEVIMQNSIVVGDYEAGFVITRSTLNRNGVFITSGLYDSGYDGLMAAVMHVTCGPMEIEEGTRIAQYLNFQAEMLHQYDGDYGHNKSHDTKYH